MLTLFDIAQRSIRSSPIKDQFIFFLEQPQRLVERVYKGSNYQGQCEYDGIPMVAIEENPVATLDLFEKYLDDAYEPYMRNDKYYTVSLVYLPNKPKNPDSQTIHVELSLSRIVNNCGVCDACEERYYYIIFSKPITSKYFETLSDDAINQLTIDGTIQKDILLECIQAFLDLSNQVKNIRSSDLIDT
jgi:hypothetical protein